MDEEERDDVLRQQESRQDGRKIVRDYEVTPASVHDKAEEDKEWARQARERNEPRSSEDDVYADSAYIHPAEALRARGYEPKLCEKGAGTDR
jgi:hypothetical protein